MKIDPSLEGPHCPGKRSFSEQSFLHSCQFDAWTGLERIKMVLKYGLVVIVT